MHTPREHIISIRKKFTGENSAINQDGEIVVNNLTELLTDAIEELSKNIYKKDSHFIMELIQNADDNEYKSGVRPFLRISQDNYRMIFQNNEIGFNHLNVDSICNIKKSTKSGKGGIKGYIGEKGIGFKSVFRVSDEPEIYSNGYQFRFNSNTNLGKKKKQVKLGYILPEWIEEQSEGVNPLYTNIVLPFKSNMKDDEKERLNEVKPNLLLFLNKLSKLDILNEVENTRVLIEKEVVGNHILLKETKRHYGTLTTTKKKYFVFERNDIKVPHELDVKERKEIKKTRIVFAFPVDSKNYLKADEEQDVYAFLPIGESGFRFLIQADFILTSGREAINEDNDWNIWIRSEIFNTFKSVITEFKKHPKYKYSFLEFIPKINETFNGFFEPLANDIINYCQDANIILSISDKWCKPNEVLTFLATENLLFDNVLVKSATGYEFVNPLCKLNCDTLDTLGIRGFSTEDIYNCLQQHSLVIKKSDTWFVDLLIYLSNHKESEEIAERLKEIQITPIQRKNLKSQNLVSTNESPVFLPLSNKHKYSFEKNICIISDGVYSKLLAIKNRSERTRIFNFLEDVNVQKPSSFKIIERYILSTYKSEEWKLSESKVLVDHLKYIKDHWSELKKQHDEIVELFGDKPIIRCAQRDSAQEDKTDYYSIPGDIYISKIYGNKNELELLFEGIKGVYFINDCYLVTKGRAVDKKIAKENTYNEWQQFFKALGCKDFPVVGFNNSCVDFSNVLSTLNPAKIKLLLRLINLNWKVYKKYTYSTKYAKSDWFRLISESRIIPIGNELYYSNQVFLKTEKTTILFGDSVKYYQDKIEYEFAKEIGVNVTVNGSAVVNYLRELSRKHTRLSNEKANKIYKYLLNDEDVELSLFTKEALIYLPKVGKWFEIKNVFWSDYSRTLGNRYGYCETSYVLVFKDLFVERIGIQDKPDITLLIKELEEIRVSHIDKVITEKEKQRIYRIYAEIGSRTLNQELGDNDCKSLQKCIWTNKGIFWKNDGDIFYNDDNDLFELFKEEESIAFIDLPKQYLPITRELLARLEIKPISEAVTTVFCNYEFATLINSLTSKVRSYSESIISMIYTLHTSFYEENKNSPLFNNLKLIEIYESPELEIEYHLNTIKKKTVTESYQEDIRIYVNRDIKERDATIAFEIAKYLNVQAISEYIIILFTGNKSLINSILLRKNIIPPPDDSSGFIIEEEYSDSISDSDYEDEKFEEVDFESDENGNLPDYNDQIQEGTGEVRTQKGETNTKKWFPEVPIDHSKVGIEMYVAEEGPQLENEGRRRNKSDVVKKLNDRDMASPLISVNSDAIGDYGEGKVYFELKVKLRNKYPHFRVEEDKKNQIFRQFNENKLVVELKWLNDKSMIQEGYDLVLMEDGLKKFYEVKTTTGNESVVFTISRKQWMFIREKESNYSIFRVINAGTEKVRVLEINNPYRLWKEGKLNAYPINIELG